LALKALGYKERTEAELAGWLRERDVGEEELAETMALLIETGALDDERFARLYAEDKRELSGWGPDRIAESLRSRGVPEALVEAAVGAETGDDVTGRACGVLRKAGASVEDDASRAKALAMLARRGYPLEVAYDAVRDFERNG
jgi:regulatory protein